MKNLFKNVLFQVLSSINKVIPKKARVLIVGGDVLYDNNEAIFEYLNYHSDYDIICLANKYRNFDLRENVFIKNYTIFNFIYYFCTSRVILDSFLRAVKIVPAKDQLSIQMWHGSGIKRCNNTQIPELSKYFTKIFSSSEIYKCINIKTFNSNGRNIIINGNPRNDLLFEPNIGSFEREEDKLVIWMPTYRHGLGVEETKKDIPVLTENNINELNCCLKNNGIHLFVKPHPLQMNDFASIIQGESNVSIITDVDIRREGISLYNFIGAMDALLTDYSSVALDYLLLDRPIGYVIDDIKEYRDNRGFMFEDPLSMMPGEKIYDIDELKEFFNTLFTDDKYKQDRKRVNNISNYYQDNRNRERVRILIEEAMKGLS